MADETYYVRVQSDDVVTATQKARELADELREIKGVSEVVRQKQDETTMDLGATVEVVITSGFALTVAKGMSDWIRRTRGVHLTIERTSGADSLKAEIQNADSQTAKFVTEMVINANRSPSQ